MEKKINVAELLKDCPKGMELDCVMWDFDVKLDKVDENCIYCIKVQTPIGELSFNKYGGYSNSEYSKCVIFPKGKTTWEGFVPPCKFKDGDIVATKNGIWIGITTGGDSEKFIPTYCTLESNGKFEIYFDYKEKWVFDRLATEEEKQKLFDAIKANGYKWNSETKTLEKLNELKFKAGDRIVKKNGPYAPLLITGLGDEYYYSNTGYPIKFLSIKEQDDWELAPNKFDITTLKPFDKVLVRTKGFTNVWTTAFYDGYRLNVDGGFRPFGVSGGEYFQQCIPYEGNEYLHGTTNDCGDYYKTWE